MVQIISEQPSFGQEISRILGGAAASAGTEALSTASQMREDKQLKAKYGIDLSGIRDPGTRSALLENELRRGLLMKSGEASIPEKYRSITSTGPGGQNLAQSLAAPTAGPERLAGVQPRQPMTQGQPAGGTLAAASAGAGQAILNPEQMGQEAANRTSTKLRQGIPTTYNDELQQIRTENADIAKYQAYQQAVGQQALKYLPDKATPEMAGIFQKKAQDLAAQNLTPAEIEQKLASEGKKFQNQLASVKNSLPPKRLGTRIKEAALGTARAAEKVKTSIRNKLKPLLDQGLYDTARELLSQKGYHPEEREELVSSLGETANKELASFPKLKRGFFEPKETLKGPAAPSPKEEQRFNQSLQSILQKDPSTNLILLRKAFEDKGFDWDIFKTGLDNLIANDQFHPNEEQLKAMDYLDEPPLDRLDQMLYRFKLIGR